MNRVLPLWAGALATILLSFAGMVVLPNWQVRHAGAVEIVDQAGETTVYPPALELSWEAPGRQVYIAQGCIYCHSQQVRPAGSGSDIERGWGERRSVPRDYLLHDPPLLGTMRTGPDLANIGARQPDRDWHHVHLYDARLVSPGSIMPPFRFLYQLRHRDPGAAGVRLPDRPGQQPAWIVPRPEARDLVAYVQTLHQDHRLEQVQ